MVASWVVDADAATARKQRCRDHRRQQRLLGGCFECAAGPEDEHYGQDKFLAHPAGEGAYGQCRGAESFDRLADPQQEAPVVAVGDLPRHQHEGGRGQELGEADQPQIECAARKGVHLPGHRHAQHLEAHGGAGPRTPIEHERTVPQDRARHGIGRFHRRAKVVGGKARRNGGTVCRADLRDVAPDGAAGRPSRGCVGLPLLWGGWLGGGWLASRGREAATGGAEGGRTPDLLIANEALSQLSYGPAKCNRAAGGCECGPFTAQGRRSQGSPPGNRCDTALR
jgi:hypothetical protein